ncbi:MAG TPA: hypothetical protein VHK63_07310 [Candidatus Limnocylindria bacterium]|nr:hypothetical protein [Candidatus Limnocylindria bacterium]
MGETLAETRVEVTAHRADMEATARELEARIRYALDFKSRFRENPALFIGLGAGAAFLVAGGPIRVARLVRRRLRPTTAEQAYDALPKSMQTWVDTLVGEVGPKADKARAALTEELQRWRNAPLTDKKARKELAKAMVEGPPGPERAGWKAAEAALTLLSAALARKAVEAFITGDRAGGPTAKLNVPPPDPKVAALEYSGFSERDR